MRFRSLSRMRKKKYVRDWLNRDKLCPQNLIMPYFTVKGNGIKKPLESLPGMYRFSPDRLVEDISGTEGLRAVLLFGIEESKDGTASGAWKRDGAVQRAAAALREKFKELVIITDVCLCGYTDHGHCGIIKKDTKRFESKKTLEALSKTALSHARSGADFVAPSAMADGQVLAIREALEKEGFENTGIFAYSAKYASSLYGPFRDALGSAPSFGDRKSYQLDTGGGAEDALREIEEDIKEGADIVMVKPALPYLDIISSAKEKFAVPLAAYSVSGEYSMIKKAAAGGIFDERKAVLEILGAVKRAGADFIITYYAKEVLRWLE